LFDRKDAESAKNYQFLHSTQRGENKKMNLQEGSVFFLCRPLNGKGKHLVTLRSLRLCGEILNV